MKILSQLAILFLISSCSQLNQKTEQTPFQKAIGLESSEVIDQLNEQLKIKLETTYQKGTYKSNLKSYLQDVADGQLNLDISKKDCTLNNKFDQIGFENKYVKENYDTIYFNIESLVLIHGKDTTFESTRLGGRTEGEYIQYRYEQGFAKLTEPGKLSGWFNKFAPNHDFYKTYAQSKKESIDISPKVAAKALLQNFEFKDNYFYQLIVLLELFVYEINSSGCE